MHQLTYDKPYGSVDSMKADSGDKATVWMIVPSFAPVIGGTETQARQQSKQLLEHGWSVRVLTRRHGSAQPRGLPARDEVDGIPVIRLYSRGGGKVGSLLYVLSGLWHLLRRGRRDIYHAHDIGAAGWLAVIARYLLGGRCIVKLRTGRYLYEERFPSGMARWQFSVLLRLADRIVVVNSEVERFVRNLGIQETRVVRIPNAVDTRWFHPVSIEQKFATRKRLGLDTSKTIVLYVGRFAPQKRIDILLNVWSLMSADVRRDAQLVLVGDGPERDKLLDMITALGIKETVFLAGMQQAVRDYYWAADIFVHPSRSEGLSNALVEAMACGLPVVASNVGGALDVVEEGKAGALFESENQDQLMEKLGSVMAMRGRWGEMGAHGRYTVQMYADLEIIVDRLDALYKQLN